MWVMMLISYLTVSYIDTRGYSRIKEKKTMVFYFTLMAVSYLIGTASGYVGYMPSPADFIKNLVLSFVGK